VFEIIAFAMDVGRAIDRHAGNGVSGADDFVGAGIGADRDLVEIIATVTFLAQIESVLIAALARHRAVADRVITELKLLPGHRREVAPKTARAGNFIAIVVGVFPCAAICEIGAASAIQCVVYVFMAADAPNAADDVVDRFEPVTIVQRCVAVRIEDA
jgi:hypothetical protein